MQFFLIDEADELDKEVLFEPPLQSPLEDPLDLCYDPAQLLLTTPQLLTLGHLPPLLCTHTRVVCVEGLAELWEEGAVEGGGEAVAVVGH